MKTILSMLVVILICFNTKATTVEQTQGDVRVILIAIEQGKTFLPFGAQDQVQSGDSYVRVTYLIECLGEDTIKRTNGGSVSLWVAGDRKSIAVSSTGHEISDSSVSKLGSTQGFYPFVLPAKLTVNRTYVEQSLFFGKLPSVEKAEVRINAGFNDKTYDFHFMDIPLK